MSEQRKRLTAEEQKDFINLCAAESLLSGNPLQKRISGIKYGKSMMAGAKGHLQKILTEVMDTMPYEQLVSYQKQMKHIGIQVGVKPVYENDDWDGRYLTFAQINELLAGCDDHCLMCEKDPATIKRCGIRKIYDTIPAETVCSPLSCE